MGDGSLFVTGDNWIYTYPDGDHSFHIIGHDVDFIERTSEKIVVQLDSQIQLNVPVSYKNVFVDSEGFHDIEINLADVPANAEMIKMVVGEQ